MYHTQCVHVCGELTELTIYSYKNSHFSNFCSFHDTFHSLWMLLKSVTAVDADLTAYRRCKANFERFTSTKKEVYTTLTVDFLF